MGTKNNPGIYDGHAKAEPEEPYFTLLGRDPIAPFLVGWWAGLKSTHDPNADEAKLKEAMETAQAMDAWCLKLNREDKLKLRDAIMQEGLRIAAAIEKEDAAVVTVHVLTESSKCVRRRPGPVRRSVSLLGLSSPRIKISSVPCGRSASRSSSTVLPSLSS
jgi:hypothetical protein